jgi:hypothetical protein
MESLRKTFKTVVPVLGAAVIAYMVFAPNFAPSEKLRGNEFTLQLCSWQLSNWKIAAELTIPFSTFQNFLVKRNDGQCWLNGNLMFGQKRILFGKQTKLTQVRHYGRGET